MPKKEKIIAVIPAYNEEGQIASPLSALTKSPLIDEIVVINDGSLDRTPEIARLFGVHLIDHKVNHGKGAALQTGINYALKKNFEIILFLDADLIGLTPTHIKKLINPLLRNKNLLMTIGVFVRDYKKGKETTVEFSGQRAIRRSFFTGLIDLTHVGFGVEKIITEHLKRIAQGKNIPVTKLYKRVKLENLIHVKKEGKYGTLEGLGARIKMGLEISKAPAELWRSDLLTKLSNLLGLDLTPLIKELEKKRLAKKIKKDQKRALTKLKRKNNG